jgi:uncharacterized protein (UPF0332 family)
MRSTKATDSLAAAMVLLEAEKYDACASRAYYAVYQASWHCFESLGLNPDRDADNGSPYWAHKCLSWSVAEHLAFDADQQESVDLLLARRVSADYSYDHLGIFEATESCELAEELLRVLHEKGLNGHGNT